jgi:hypothetical protein
MFNVFIQRYVVNQDIIEVLGASFTNLMKVLGALVKSKGMTNHLDKSNLVLKAVFHSSPSFIFIWW